MKSEYICTNNVYASSCNIVVVSAIIFFSFVSPSFSAQYEDSLKDLASKFKDPSAQYFLGKKYYQGREYPQDKAEAATWYEKAALGGHVKAQYYLGKMYFYGDGIKQNKAAAQEYLQKAANQDFTDAKYELGNLFRKGINGKPNFKTALIWYKAAAKDEHPEAAYMLGKFLYQGRGSKTDIKAATKWLKLAVELGHQGAEKYLANLPNKRTIAKNTRSKPIKKPRQRTKISVAKKKQTIIEPSNDFASIVDKDDLKQAKTGDVDAQYNVGMQLLDDDDGQSIASKWLRKAAEQDHAGAQFQLGKMYRDGVGVSKSESEAIKWFRLASSWGVSNAQKELDNLLRRQLIVNEDLFRDNPQLADSNAQYTLGLMYTNGDGVGQDVYTAIQWLQKAAEQNHSEAQFKLGEIYKDGIGIESDFAKAKMWLAKAADSGLSKAGSALQEILNSEEKRIGNEQLAVLRSSPAYGLIAAAQDGEPEAQYKVGVMYIEGKTLSKDVKKGLIWVERAAEDHNVMAQLTLGELYLHGDKVEKDYMQAIRWYKMAAESGNSEAQYSLGNIYRRGLGVKRSNSNAVKWYRLAAKQGHVKARKKLGGCRIC